MSDDYAKDELPPDAKGRPMKSLKMPECGLWPGKGPSGDPGHVRKIPAKPMVWAVPVVRFETVMLAVPAAHRKRIWVAEDGTAVAVTSAGVIPVKPPASVLTNPASLVISVPERFTGRPPISTWPAPAVPEGVNEHRQSM